MTCHHCPKVALYRVGERGYCAEHRKEAVFALRDKGAASQSTDEARRKYTLEKEIEQFRGRSYE